MTHFASPGVPLDATDYYCLQVIACHDYREGERKKSCSNRAVVSARTLPDHAADTLDPRNVSVVQTSRLASSVWIQWKDPPSPNGLVVLYDLELSRVEVSNVSRVFV